MTFVDAHRRDYAVALSACMRKDGLTASSSYTHHGDAHATEAGSATVKLYQAKWIDEDLMYLVPRRR